MSRIVEVSLRQAWIWGLLVMGVLAGLSGGSVILGIRNELVVRQAANIQGRLDSLRPAHAALDRQHNLLQAIRQAVPSVDGGTATLVAREIDRNAVLYGFDPLVILAVVVTESRLDGRALGRYSSGTNSGAQGMMQIKSSTARAMAEAMGFESPDDRDLLDPAYNLSVGVAYLLQMVHRYRDLRLGIMAYNVGPSALESGLRGQRDLPEAYYRKVWLAYRKLSSRSAGT